MTYTYVLLPVSEACYEEIRKKLEDAGYAHCFHPNPGAPASPRIDMHGIALVPEVEMISEDNPPGKDPVKIGKDGLCKCDCGTTCPLGRMGMEMRCTATELEIRGIEIEREET